MKTNDKDAHKKNVILIAKNIKGQPNTVLMRYNIYSNITVMMLNAHQGSALLISALAIKDLLNENPSRL